MKNELARVKTVREVFKKNILVADNIGRLRSQFNTCGSEFLHKGHKI